MRRVAVGLIAVLLCQAQVASAGKHHHYRKHIKKQTVKVEQSEVVDDNTSDKAAPKPNLSDYLKKLRIRTHGYISAGGGVTNAESVYSAQLTPVTGTNVKPDYHGLTHSFSFRPYTYAAIQFDAPITENLTAVTQLIAKDDTNFNVEANWAYLHWQAMPNLLLQAGLIRIPVFLYSDTLDVGYTYPWITPPQEVYGQVPLPNITGVQMIFTIPIGDYNLDIHPFYGNNRLKYAVAGTPTTISAKDAIGSEITFGNEKLQIRASYLHAEVDIDNTPTYIPINPLDLTKGYYVLPTVRDCSTQYFGAAVKAKISNVLLISEITERRIQGYIPDNRAWFVLLGYQFDKVLPYVTYSNLKTIDKGDRAVTNSAANNALIKQLFDGDQHTVEVGIRYDVTSSIALKASFQRITVLNGTSGLFSIAPAHNRVNVGNVAVQGVF